MSLPRYDEWISQMPGEDCCPHCLVEFDPAALTWVDQPAEPGQWHGTARCPNCREVLHAYDVLDCGMSP